jgi:biopolymer transport protein ExbB/TolQ
MSGNLLQLWGQMGNLARAVVFLLAAMSLYSMTVVIERVLSYRRARRQSERFAVEVAELVEAGRLSELLGQARGYPRSHVARVFAAGVTEFLKKRRAAGADPEEALEAARRAAERTTLVTVAELRRGTGGLATIGATAPFVGLFGTVVGIINAFAKIAHDNTGGIGVVSAGIAEALVTTAFGLAVALPAVWAFNYLIGRVEQFQVEMASSSSELVEALADLRASQAVAVPQADSGRER